MAHISATAKILAAAETTDTLFYRQEMLKEFYYTASASMVTDSNVASGLSTSNHEPTSVILKVNKYLLFTNCFEFIMSQNIINIHRL